MINHFTVQNYKCLGSVDIPLTPVHVLIGQNDAGKSSVLEAMFTLFRTPFMGVAEAFPGVWSGRELVNEASSAPEVRLGCAWECATGDTWRYSISVTFPVTGKVAALTSENVAGEKGEAINLLSGANSETLVAGYKRNPVASSMADTHLRSIADHLNKAQLHRLDPKMMAVPSALDASRRFTMDLDGFGLASLLDDILGYDVDRFKAVRETFCRFFPQFLSIKIKTEQAMRRHGTSSNLQQLTVEMGKGIWFETRSGNEIRAQQASAGALLILGYLALSYTPDPPELLLIEEPENGIYPKRLEQVIHLLREFTAQRAPQIVMTTHSPYMLGLFRPEEVTFMLRQSHGSVTARPMRDAPHIHERLGREFNLGELWYNLSEEDLFGNG